MIVTFVYVRAAKMRCVTEIDASTKHKPLFVALHLSQAYQLRLDNILGRHGTCL